MKIEKILVVDDHAELLALLTKNLIQNFPGSTILVASNGEQATEIASIEKPSIIIMDWDMPILSGIESIKILKKNATTAHIPVILITGVMINQDHLQTAFDAGAIDFIRKPIIELELVARIKAVLSLIESQQTIHHQNIIILEQQNALFEEELESAKNEVKLKSFQLNQISTLPNLILDEIEELSKLFSAEQKFLINDLVKKNRLKCNLLNYNDFETISGGLNLNFFKNLHTKYPTLTKNERKLCFYLKLNYSNKEIAAFLNQSEESIKKVKQRMKFKFNVAQIQEIDKILVDL